MRVGVLRKHVGKTPTVWQLRMAILKNVCSPTDSEREDFTVSRFIRSSKRMEGDSQLGLLMFVGLANYFGYPYRDIAQVAAIERAEYQYKLTKFKRKSRSNDSRFQHKLRLVLNYLDINYGIKVL